VLYWVHLAMSGTCILEKSVMRILLTRMPPTSVYMILFLNERWSFSFDAFPFPPRTKECDMPFLFGSVSGGISSLIKVPNDV
jgi:hypothetical protein